MVKVRKDLTGIKFGRLKVLCQSEDYVKPNGEHNSKWFCKCDCGEEVYVMGNNLNRGTSTSCGCKQKENLVKRSCTHGLSKHLLYQVWHNIIQRCTNPKSNSFVNYGGRGVTVCNEWSNDFLKFIKFCTNNGWNSSLEIDRIDNNKGYYPNNCHFVTKSENCINRRKRKDNTSGYIGVVWDKKNSKWGAKVTNLNSIDYLGQYSTKKEALKSRNKHIIKNNFKHKVQEYDD